MAGPNMSDELYRKLTPRQRRVYWALVIAAASFIGYMLLLYRT
jgi:hypothetical protein